MDQGALTVVTGPASEPVTLADLKAHLRLDAADNSQDTMLTAYLGAVRAHIENIAGLAFLTQTLEWAVDQFPWADGPLHRVAGSGFYWPGSIAASDNRFGAIQVPRPPLQSVTSITYLDASGASVVLDPTLYLVDLRSTPGRLTPAYGRWWPTTRWQPNAVVVRYVAGAATVGAIDPDLLQALRVALGALYEYREDLVDGSAPADTGVVRRLLAPFRVWTAA